MRKHFVLLLVGVSLVVLLSPVLLSMTHTMGAGISEDYLDEIEQRLTYGGWTETLLNALWAVDQGESVIPYIDLLLIKLSRQEIDRLDAGAFPFNAIWALAQIGGDKAYDVLIRHHNSMTTALAIEALEARKQDPLLRVLMNAESLYRLPSYEARIIAKLEEGCRVIVLSDMVINECEEGPRGGSAWYDYIFVPERQIRGYIMRGGIGFPPYF